MESAAVGRYNIRGSTSKRQWHMSKQIERGWKMISPEFMALTDFCVETYYTVHSRAGICNLFQCTANLTKNILEKTYCVHGYRV